MRLIGMLDSPYVRRVAISLEYLGVAFVHEPLSVFSTFHEFQAVNPVVKAPSLVCDNGDVLMDSSLILQFVEATRAGSASLWSRDAEILQHEMRIVGLALAACEKSVQMVYERHWRPASAQYTPWIDRITGQLKAAYADLERTARIQSALFCDTSQAGISLAVAWQFTQSLLAPLVPAQDHPYLSDWSVRMENTTAFQKYPPVGPGVPPDLQ